MPDSVRMAVPTDPPEAGSYLTLGRIGDRPEEIQLGVGHLHYSESNLSTGLAPGADDWFRRVELPLSRSPGERPTAWIVDGWILRESLPPESLTTRGLVETGYEEPSFVVLENRSDGWLHIRYSDAEGDAGSAWIPSCALDNSEGRLDFTPWSAWLLSDFISPLFFRSANAEELRAAPSAAAAAITLIVGDYSLEPLEVQGEWMRVIVSQPSDFCAPDVVPARSEGWIRWFSPDRGPRVWYFTRGC